MRPNAEGAYPDRRGRASFSECALDEEEGDAVLAPLTPADICYAALMEIRPDLAELVQFFIDVDGTWHLEPLGDVSDADWEIMQRAERLALGHGYS